MAPGHEGGEPGGEAPPHSAVPVHGGGEYHRSRDPDDEPSAEADLALLMFRALTLITATAAILCMVVNLVSLLRSFRWKIDIFIGILRIYAVIFAGFVAIAETEWQWLFRKWPYLESWTGRGMLQVFVAVMTKALSGASWEVRFERIMHDIAAWCLLGCGFIYSFAGVLCMRQIRRRRIQKKAWRDNAIKELQELDKQRRELQGLLAEGA